MENKTKDFIRKIIDEHNKTGRFDQKVHTRFPPEPNGYIHIGHAKSILLNYGIAEEYGGKFNLRFDDTNPSKEETEYVDAIKEDVRWLGADWEDRLFFASNYFDQLYEYAIELIKKGKAYVDELSPKEIREYRGTLKKPGKNSPYRDRSIEENLELFEKMKNGDFEEGSKTLRAKIDMSSPNINMRDPVMYRISKSEHHRTGDKWCIYPMYDFTHCLSDSIEKITHSICTLEFEDNRPLYDWYLDQLELYHPQQIEFARLNLNFTVMSKRKLLKLVKENYVNGWDDPRMPTIRGFRRRGYTTSIIQEFMKKIGVAKSDSTVDIALLEHVARDEFNKTLERRMVVLDPVKVTITNYPKDKIEWFDAENNPEDETAGTRKIPFSRNIFIERKDFQENPHKKFFRLGPGREVRIKHAYYITCQDYKKDKDGNIIEILCTYDPESRGGYTPDRRRVKGTLQYVTEKHAIEAEVRIYDRLFSVEDPAHPEEGKEFTDYINPDSLRVIENALIEPAMKDVKHGDSFQFMRDGYYIVDQDSTEEKKVFNRIVSLRDSWKKIVKQMRNQKKQK
ncbi:MAG: glutamine--tRNA ligase/YqeY domain fusion protein [Candidatus Zixiibacteriota bacterium]